MPTQKAEARKGQFYCGKCKLAIGLSGQPACYQSLVAPISLCPDHFADEARALKREEELYIHKRT